MSSKTAKITGVSIVGLTTSARVDFPEAPIEFREGDKISVTWAWMPGETPERSREMVKDVLAVRFLPSER